MPPRYLGAQLVQDCKPEESKCLQGDDRQMLDSLDRKANHTYQATTIHFGFLDIIVATHLTLDQPNSISRSLTTYETYSANSASTTGSSLGYTRSLQPTRSVERTR
jgi:hypothetical protein